MGGVKFALKAAHETASGLRDASLMDAKTKRDFDVLCLPKVRILMESQIKSIRERSKASQAVFAAYSVSASATAPCVALPSASMQSSKASPHREPPEGGGWFCSSPFKGEAGRGMG